MGLVVVSVTVVTDVLTVVVVEGAGASVVVGVDDVVGTTVVVLVTVGGGGTGAADDCAVVGSDEFDCGAVDVADDEEVAVTLVEVPAGLFGLPELVKVTTA